MKGLVLRSTGSWYSVKMEDGNVMDCRLKGKFKQGDNTFTNPIAVGDRVEVTPEADQDTGMITRIFPRDNYLVRMSTRKKHGQHIMASNLDQAMLIVSIRFPKIKLGFIDRFLVACEAYHVPAVLVFNKKDLYKEKDLERYEEVETLYEPLGYTCKLVSAISGEGLDVLKSEIEGQVSLFAGHSGVGKSTLLNAMYPSLDLKTASLSGATGKGKHTTTFAQMHAIDEGGYVIDTPGVKELTVADMEPGEVSGYFPEMRERLQNCKFNDCLHMNEPGCAVMEALKNGEIAWSRYENYVHMVHDLEEMKDW